MRYYAVPIAERGFFQADVVRWYVENELGYLVKDLDHQPKAFDSLESADNYARERTNKESI